MVSSLIFDSESQYLKPLVRIDGRVNEDFFKETPIAKNANGRRVSFNDDFMKMTPSSIMQLLSTSTDPSAIPKSSASFPENGVTVPWAHREGERSFNCTNIDFPFAPTGLALPPSKLDTRARTRKKSSDIISNTVGILNEAASRRKSTDVFIYPSPTYNAADKENPADDNSSTKAYMNNQVPEPCHTASASCFNTIYSTLFTSHDETSDEFDDSDVNRQMTQSSPKKLKNNVIFGASEEPAMSKSTSVDKEIEAIRDILSKDGRPLTADTLKKLHQSLMISTSDPYFGCNRSDRVKQIISQNVDHDGGKKIVRKSKRHPKSNDIMNGQVPDATEAIPHSVPSTFGVGLKTASMDIKHSQYHYKNPSGNNQILAAFCSDSLDGITNLSRKAGNHIRPNVSGSAKERDGKRKIECYVGPNSSESAQERDGRKKVENNIESNISSSNEELDGKKTYTLSSFVGLPRRKDHAPNSSSKRLTKLSPRKISLPQTHEIRITRQIYKKSIRTEVKQKVSVASMADKNVLKTLPCDNTTAGKMGSEVKNYNAIARRSRKKNRRESNQMWEV